MRQPRLARGSSEARVDNWQITSPKSWKRAGSKPASGTNGQCNADERPASAGVGDGQA